MIRAAALRVVLYEGAGARALDDVVRLEIVRTLLERGYAVSSARKEGAVDAPAHGATLVLGRFEREQPVSKPSPDGAGKVFCRDIEGLESAAVACVVESVRAEAALCKPGGWKPWFPVIDWERCTNCMQCLSFCLFDVYASAERRIGVQNPANCKTDCPACSRVCPQLAIMFPKYKGGPINGEEIRGPERDREGMKVDVSALLGGDIYTALRDRSARARFGDDRRAMEERRRCLEQLRIGK